MYDVRLYISKMNNTKYVSHLDMFRLMQRAVRRADIPLWYTEGFNPHPYISFLQALPLGVESAREPCDIRIMTEMKPAEIKERLNAVMPGDFRIADAVIPFNKPTEIMWSEYEFIFSADTITVQELNDILSRPDLTCEKTGKSGKKKVTKEISVSEHIARFTVTENPEVSEDGDGLITLRITVSAGNSFNLSPANLLNALSREAGREITAERIIRIAFLTDGFSLFE